MKLLHFRKPVDLTGYTLIIPSVSVGNVPQLTVDLLITTLKLDNVAPIWHPAIVPSVGSEPFYDTKNVVCTACELYCNEQLKLAAVQIRSTIEKRLALKFIQDFLDCFGQFGLKELYVLTSGFDYELHNISNKDTYYMASNGNLTKRDGWKVLEKDPKGKFQVSGAGLGVKLYEAVGSSIKATLVVKYVSEGENHYDAQGYLQKLFQLLEITENNLVQPTSWRHVYGAPPPIGLF